MSHQVNELGGIEGVFLLIVRIERANAFFDFVAYFRHLSIISGGLGVLSEQTPMIVVIPFEMAIQMSENHLDSQLLF